MIRMGAECARKCFIPRYGHTWLSSYETLRKGGARCIRENEFHGPARVQAGPAASMDQVFTLLCCSPLRCMDAYYHRQRSSHWPSDRTMGRLRNARGTIVCAGHKLSPEQDQRLQFRFSFSCQELLLANDMPPWVKQGYVAFKRTLKAKLLHVRRDTVSEGRSKMSSYHFKTVLLWALEDPEAWGKLCPFRLMMLLLASLKSYLQLCPPVLSHYFIPQCNLLETTDIDDIRLTLRIIDDVQGDPVASIIKTRTSPGFLYSGADISDSRFALAKDRIGTRPEQVSSADILSAFQRLRCREPSRRPFRWLMLGCVLSRMARHRNWHRGMMCYSDYMRNIASPRPQVCRILSLKTHIYPKLR